MKGEGLSEQEARSHFSVIDRNGLLHSRRKELSPQQAVYAQLENHVSGWPRTSNEHIGLADVIAKINATILIGLSTVGGAFSESIVREMAQKVERPIMFPLSKEGQAGRTPANEMASELLAHNEALPS